MPSTENSKNSTTEKQIAMFSIHSDPLSCLGSQQSGGQNLYVLSLAEELSKLGWKIDVFTRWDNPRKKQIANINKDARVIRLKGGKVGYITKTELMDVLPEIYRNFLIFINDQNPYSLFHGHYWDGGWTALAAYLQFKEPLVTNFHSLGIVRIETRKRYLKNEEDRKYFSKRFNIENEIIKNSALIISLAETEKQDLHRLYGCPFEKVMVIPGGVDLKIWSRLDKKKAREELNFKEDDFILLYVGRFEWRKGIGTLTSAASLLKNDIPNLKVLIVGGQIFGQQKNPEDYKEYKRLSKKVKEEQVENIVRFTGRINNSRLPIFYSASNILVVPSYYEPFGLVALEGMASKIPVIASDVGGLASTIKNNENGLLFEPRNPVRLKEKVLMIYNSNELAEKLVQNAYEDVKKYSWKLIAKKVSDIYKELIFTNKNENSSNSSI